MILLVNALMPKYSMMMHNSDEQFCKAISTLYTGGKARLTSKVEAMGGNIVAKFKECGVKTVVEASVNALEEKLDLESKKIIIIILLKIDTSRV
jgi:molybdenum-dependent DNA-binding transcriptional regulator ModE